MSTLFTKIINGEIPSYKVAEDENFYAFLDINPLERGHTLVVPKIEVDYIFDMESKQLASFNLFAQRVAKAIDKSIDCKRVGIAVIGLEVAHAHIHLIPLHQDAINFSKKKLNLQKEQFLSIAKAISNNFI